MKLTNIYDELCPRVYEKASSGETTVRRSGGRFITNCRKTGPRLSPVFRAGWVTSVPSRMLSWTRRGEPGPAGSAVLPRKPQAGLLRDCPPAVRLRKARPASSAAAPQMTAARRRSPPAIRPCLSFPLFQRTDGPSAPCFSVR